MTHTHFRNIAQQAREQRLDGPHYNNTEHPLIGQCFDNAYVLYTLLQEHGYEPTFVVGSTPRVAQDINLETVTTIEDLAGFVHYWVECNEYTIDISSDTFDNLGEIVVEKNPNMYYTFTDSYSEGKETLNQGKRWRCSYCGAKHGTCKHTK